jgi:5-methylcytosine-specific restriction protein A
MPIENIKPNQPNAQFSIGQKYNRQRDLHDRFGGNRQSGIAVCAKHPIILLFESPSGKEVGYKDGYTSRDTYYYTGEGGRGDMQFIRGNKAILNHQIDGRALHLFKKIKTGLYEYIGQFFYHP